MRSAVIYLRMPPGTQPDSFPPSWTDGAAAVLAASPDDLGRLSDALSTYPGFLGKDDLQRITSECVSDPTSGKSIADLIWDLTRHVLQWEMAPQALLTSIYKRLDKTDAKKLDAVKRKELKNRLLLLIGLSPALQRQWKAEQLADELGFSLEEIRIVSDLRPVFTEDRQTVEGIFPVTLCKLVWSDVDGIPRGATFRLSLEQLDMFAKQIENARKKVTVLKKLLVDNKFHMPTT